jgi:hypothetical protein
MNRPYVCFILCFLCVGANAQTTYQHNTPEGLVNQFFSASSFPDKSNFFTDEMIKQINYPSIGEELRGEGTSKLKEIQRSNDEAVFSVNVSKYNDQKDFYCYLKNQDGWKISAIRTFIIPAYYNQLADSILNDAGLPDSTKLIAHSIRLLSGNDENLKNHLKLNFNDFKSLLDQFRNEANSEIHSVLQQLYLSSVYKPDQLIDCFFFTILEINYLEAGYIYCKDRLGLPKISPDAFIIIEEVVKDWYLYRRN